MNYKRKKETKLCIARNSKFSLKMANHFNDRKIISFEELWRGMESKYLSDTEKTNYDIIQFSFVILNKENKPLFIERKKHNITKGYSILQSCSPHTYLKYGECPSSVDDIRDYFEQEIDHDTYEYGIDLFGVARNVRKKINYFFYIFRIDFSVEEPKISIKTEDDNLKGFRGPKSSHLLKDNKVDLLVMKALFPELSLLQDEIEGCVLLRDKNHDFCNMLFLKNDGEISHKQHTSIKIDLLRN